MNESFEETVRAVSEQYREVLQRLADGPKKTRLVEPVETGLSAEDRETLRCLRGALLLTGGIDESHESIDFLDRIPKMIEDRDNELADAEWEIICLRERAECAERILTDALARGQVCRCQGKGGDGFGLLAPFESSKYTTDPPPQPTVFPGNNQS